MKYLDLFFALCMTLIPILLLTILVYAMLSTPLFGIYGILLVFSFLLTASFIVWLMWLMFIDIIEEIRKLRKEGDLN